MHLGSRWTAVALATLACSLSLPASAQGRPDLVAASLNDPGRAHVAGEVLVQFRRGATDDQRRKVTPRRHRRKLVALTRSC